MTSDRLFAAASVGTRSTSVAEVPVVRDRRRRGQQVELVGTIDGFDLLDSTVTIVDVQDGRRRHAELTVTLVAGAVITVDGQRRALSTVLPGQKAIVAGVLDGTALTAAELHALTITGPPVS